MMYLVLKGGRKPEMLKEPGQEIMCKCVFGIPCDGGEHIYTGQCSWKWLWTLYVADKDNVLLKINE